MKAPEFFRVSRHARTPIAIPLALSAVAVVVVAAWFRTPSETSPVGTPAPPVGDRAESDGPQSLDDLRLVDLQHLHPAVVPIQGYVGSDACRTCHEDNHASWHASYHRTMTQRATPEAVMGDFDQKVVVKGREYELFRRGDLCWAKMDNPDVEEGGAPARLERPIVMTTGSHHMQVCWYPTGEGRTLAQLPLVFLKEINRWIPRSAAFLKPGNEGYSHETARWNKTCSRCHTTFARAMPGQGEMWHTEVAEFGITCEACHGPGEEHIALRQEKLEPTSLLGKDPIVNPTDLPHQRASQVCGQCHSMVTPKQDVKTKLEGSAYRPGFDLLDSHFLVRDDALTRGFYRNFMSSKELDTFMQMSFYADGMIRVSGREYNGLVDSACYQRGEMQCMSCHSLHKTAEDPRPLNEWADDQLKHNMNGDQACLQCHDASEYGDQHTHHSKASSGSRCYNCHMPHSTYGLLKAIRSHQISSPNVRSDEAVRRPNACNLCHLDRSLQWSADHLHQWYDTKLPELEEAEQQTAAGVLWALRGDASQRALTAWSMSWPAAVEASGSDWQAGILAQLLVDPYDAVRFIAERSLRSLPDAIDFEYDFVGPEAARDASRQRLLSVWRTHRKQQTTRKNAAAVLLDDDGRLDQDEVEQLLQQRDDRRVELVE